MAKYAAIDIGSNSVLLLIAEKDLHGHWQTLVDKVDVTRLSEGLQATGVLKAESINRTARAVKNFVRLIRKQGVTQVAAVGTMCLRTAKNARDFLQKVEDECGLAIEIISGEEEARLSYFAVKTGIGLSEGKHVIFDIGGGSTEFIFVEGERIERIFSINIGAAGLTEKYLISDPVTKEELATMLKVVRDAFSDFEFDEKPDTLIGIGGTITTIGAVKHRLTFYQPDIVHGDILHLTEIERQLELYLLRPIEERKTIVGLQAERADVILAGVGIVRTVLEKLGVDEVMISARGIRHGLLADKFG